MSTKRRTISPDFKAKVALAAIRGDQTVNEITVKYQVHPNHVTRWKKQAQENRTSLFADGREKEKKDESAEIIDRLYHEAGRLQVDLSWLKKNTRLTIEEKRAFVDPKNRKMKIDHQCDLLDLPLSTYYYAPRELNDNTLQIMRTIDEEWTRHPFKGKRSMCVYLKSQGYSIGVKRTRTLMERMGLISMAPGPHTSKPHPEHKRYPYLLRNLEITELSYAPNATNGSGNKS